MKKIKNTAVLIILSITLLVTSCDLFTSQQPDGTIYIETLNPGQIPSPKDLTLEVTADGIVMISWEPVTNAKYYEIYRRPIDDELSTEGKTKPADESDILGLSSWTFVYQTTENRTEDKISSTNNLQKIRYEYAVRTIFDENRPGLKYTENSPLSRPKIIDLSRVEFPAKGSLLGTPANVTISQYSDTIKVFWDKVNYATGYEVYMIDTITESGYATYTKEKVVLRKISSTTPTQTDTTFTLSGTNKKRTYAFFVRATYSGNYFLTSEFAQSSVSTAVAEVTAPSTPSVVSLADRVQIKWPEQQSANSYIVYASSDNGITYTALDSTASNFYKEVDGSNEVSIIYEHSTATPTTPAVKNINYVYKVTAVENGVESSYSSSVTSAGIQSDLITVNNPASVTASDGDYSNKVLVSWPKSASNGVDQYIIYRMDSSDNANNMDNVYTLLVPAQVFPKMLNNDQMYYYEDTTVTAGETLNTKNYTYKIVSYNSTLGIRGSLSTAASNTGYISPTLSVRKSIAIPTGLALTPGASTIQLSWNEVKSSETISSTQKSVALAAESYTIYYAAEPTNVNYNNTGVGTEYNFLVYSTGITKDTADVTYNSGLFTVTDIEKLPSAVTLAPGVEYIFAIQSNNATESMDSDKSAIVRGYKTTLPTPNVVITNLPGTNDLTLIMNKDIVAPGAITYTLYRSATDPTTNSYTGTFVGNYTSNTTNTITGIVDEYYWIAATYGTGISYSIVTQNITN